MLFTYRKRVFTIINWVVPSSSSSTPSSSSSSSSENAKFKLCFMSWKFIILILYTKIQGVLKLAQATS